MASARARWRKVWADLWSTPSLLHLDHSTLYLLVFLIVHATWDPGGEEGSIQWGYDRDTRLMKIRKMARMHHRTLTKSMEALIAEKCIRVDDTGVYLPNYGRWQETADAARKRRNRTGQSDGLSAETPSPSPSTSPSDLKEELHERAAQIPTRGSQMATDLAQLSHWRQWGGDPEGLGPWPKPTAPDGTTLPQLTIPARGSEILMAGRSAQDVHRLAHTLGRMVTEGALPKTDHRGSYVFTGHYESFEQKALDWAASQSSRKDHSNSAPAEITPERLEMLQRLDVKDAE